jgi:hypothetical protein
MLHVHMQSATGVVSVAMVASALPLVVLTIVMYPPEKKNSVYLYKLM